MVSELGEAAYSSSLQVAKGNKKRAASLLHLKRTTFVEKLRRMGMEPADSDSIWILPKHRQIDLFG